MQPGEDAVIQDGHADVACRGEDSGHPVVIRGVVRRDHAVLDAVAPGFVVTGQEWPAIRGSYLQRTEHKLLHQLLPCLARYPFGDRCGHGVSSIGVPIDTCPNGGRARQKHACKCLSLLRRRPGERGYACLLYTSDAADEEDSV